MNEHFDLTTLIVIMVTFLLFVAALFTKGFTHDLFLEAGVFLVSVKLILMGYRNSVMNRDITEQLREIKTKLEKHGN